MDQRRRAAVLGVAALAVLALGVAPGGSLAYAQTPPNADRWITEFGVAAFVGPAPGHEDRRALLSWEVGRTFLARGRTVAATAFALANDNQFRLGGRARYYLIDGDFALWIGPGVALWQSDDDLRVELEPGLVLDVGLGSSRYGVAFAEAETGRGEPGFRVGARASSVVGAVLGLAVPLTVIVAQR